MDYVIIIFISICISLFFILKYKQKQDRYIQHFLADARNQYIRKNREQLENEINSQLSLKKEEVAKTTEQLLKVQKILGDYEEKEKERIFKRIETLKKEKIEKIEEESNSYKEERVQQITEELNKIMAENAIATQQAAESLNQLQAALADFQKKQDAVNAEIMRRREIEEKEDFYRVNLSEEALADIKILKETRKNLKKPEIIDKIIYDNYIGKPVLEMEKRVLSNTTCSGIYKITCLTTGEIYVGKSTDIKTRWQQHCKSAFNCGTIASSLLHTKMKKYGIENFTFELLEKVPKEKLTEREKFYINFYKTKEVGMNERLG